MLSAYQNSLNQADEKLEALLEQIYSLQAEINDKSLTTKEHEKKLYELFAQIEILADEKKRSILLQTRVLPELLKTHFMIFIKGIECDLQDCIQLVKLLTQMDEVIGDNNKNIENDLKVAHDNIDILKQYPIIADDVSKLETILDSYLKLSKERDKSSQKSSLQASIDKYHRVLGYIECAQQKLKESLNANSLNTDDVVVLSFTESLYNLQKTLEESVGFPLSNMSCEVFGFDKLEFDGCSIRLNTP